MPKPLRLWNYLQSPDRAMLLTAAKPISVADLLRPDTRKFIDDMIITMRQANGVGLAAPQVGRSVRIAVVIHPESPHLEPYILINPAIDQLSTQMVSDEEGCLSVPGVYGITPRHESLRLRALDRAGQPYELVATQLLARIIQHEVDHLNGRLFVKRATAYTSGQSKLPA